MKKNKYKTDDEFISTKAIVYRSGRCLYFFDEINPTSVVEAIKHIDEMEKESIKLPIEILLNTGGGSCYEGLALFDRIINCKCKTCIIGTGLVASMGLLVFLAGQYRYVTPYTTLMNHQLSSAPEGKVKDLKTEMREINRLEAICNQIIAERTGQTIKKIKADTENKDDYIIPERAIQEGFAHKILKRK